MKWFTRVGIAALLAVCAVTWAGGAWAINIDGDNYSDEDLAVIKAIKRENPGVLATMNLDNPAIVDGVVTAEEAVHIPLSEVGDTLKFWIRDNAESEYEDEYSGDFVGWIRADGTWRVFYFTVSGTTSTSFDPSRLPSLPYLSNLVFNDEDSSLTSVALPALPNLYLLEIYSHNVKTVDVSKLTALTGFGLIRTRVESLTLPPSSNLAYLRLSQNEALTDLSGFYAKQEELDSFVWTDNDMFYGNSALQQHTITITPSANGTITKNGGDKIYNGDSVTFTVKADAGYKVGTFTIDGSPVALTGSTYTHKATGNVTAAATFVEDSGTDEAADVNLVVQAIEDYGLSANAAGKTITVTGGTAQSPVVLPDSRLYLSDISGLTIDWQANVTCASSGQYGYLVRVDGNGTLKITNGFIKLPESYNRWITAFLPGSDVNVEISGGTIQGRGTMNCAVNVNSEVGSGKGALTISGGTIDIPRGGYAISAPYSIAVTSQTAINGMLLEEEGEIYIYGQTTTVTASDAFFVGQFAEEEEELSDTLSYTVTDGATWNIESVTLDSATDLPGVTLDMTVRSGGTLNVKNTHLKFKGSLIVRKGGTLYIDDTSSLEVIGKIIIEGGGVVVSGGAQVKVADSNNGTLNNSGKLTILAGSSLTNEGTINNEGTIVNDGTFTNNGEFIVEPGSTVEGKGTIGGANAGEVTSGTEKSSGSESSSGGCDTGLGLFGLSLAGLAARKYRKA
jgi:hypothetical protein